MQAKSSSSEQSARSFIESARRAQIVRAALDTIAELGFANASFAKIAKRAGLSSTGMISYHFDGKDDLVTEAMRDVLTAAAVEMGPRIHAETSGPARLRAYLEANIAFIAEHPTDMKALLEILRNSTGEPAWFLQSISLLEEAFREGQRAGEFGEFDPRVMAITVRQAIDGLHALLAAEPQTDTAAYAQQLVRIFALATACS
ncbi:TetR/AcrR family transcriptional regulator [Amycolatopsis minnesotensis]